MTRDELGNQTADALAKFVIRVAQGESISETEVAVLPEVARILSQKYLR